MLRPPPFGVRTMLIAVAVLAGLLGLGLEAVRLKRLSDKYRYIAWAIGNDVRMNHANLVQLEARRGKLLGVGNVDRNSLPEPVRIELEVLDRSMEFRHAALAASANLVLAYEHVASHPWETLPDFLPPHLNVGAATLKGVPVIQRLLAQTSPAPPAPAEFAQPPQPEPEPPPAPPPPTPRP